MATLPQRFKLLATRCAAGAPSPSRSPAPGYAGAASPGYRLRRRGVRGAGATSASARRRGRLCRFLCRRGGGGGAGTGAETLAAARQEDDRKPLFGGRPGDGGRTLRDLFVASPEAGRRKGGCSCDCGDVEDDDEDDGRAGGAGADPAGGGGGGGGGAWRGGRRFGSGGLRSLLMRRSWRPVLVAIPEGDGSKIELGATEE